MGKKKAAPKPTDNRITKYGITRGAYILVKQSGGTKLVRPAELTSSQKIICWHAEDKKGWNRIDEE